MYAYDAYDYGYDPSYYVGAAEPPPFPFQQANQWVPNVTAGADRSGFGIKLRVGQILGVDLSEFFPYAGMPLRLALGQPNQPAAFASWDGGEGAPAGTPAAMYGDQSYRTPGPQYRPGDEAMGPQALHYFGHGSSGASWLFQALRPGKDIILVLMYPPTPPQPGAMQSPLIIYRLSVTVVP